MHAKLKSALRRLVAKHDELQKELDASAESQQRLQGCAERLRLAETLNRELHSHSRHKAEQLRKAHGELAELKQRHMSMLQQRDGAHKQLSAAMGKLSLLEANRKSMSLENERMHQISDSLKRDRADLRRKISAMEQTAMKAQCAEQQLQKHLSASTGNVAELQRQNERLARDLERTSKDREQLQRAARTAQRELTAMRDAVLPKQTAELERQTRVVCAMKKEQEHLQALIGELTLEREAALKSLECADAKVRGLETIIRNLRMDHFCTDEAKDASSKLKTELDEMKELNQRLNDRLSVIQRC